MRRGSVLVFGSLLAACAAGGAASTNAPEAPVIPSGSPEAGVFVFGEDAGNDAGPLLASCDPASASSCPTGFTCFATHTSTTWWVDLYGKCTFGCTSQTLALCASMDGVCGCPVAADGTSACGGEGGTPAVPVSDASTADGAASDDAGEAPAPVTSGGMVCVPAVKPGTQPGANEGDGGCGTPGCGGGAEAGSLPVVDSGVGD